MRLEQVSTGDIVLAAIKGRTGIYGEVTEIKGGVVYFRPISPAAGWRHASAREIVAHWRKTGRRRGGGDGDEPVSRPPEQLALRVST